MLHAAGYRHVTLGERALLGAISSRIISEFAVSHGPSIHSAIVLKCNGWAIF
jgi:hypothetical protein